MNKEIMQNRWHEMRVEAQHRWNKLTDEDLEGTRGQVNKLVDTVGQRYGYSRDVAEREVDRFINDYARPIGETATGWFAGARSYLMDNPWVGILAALLTVGVVAAIIFRPRDY